MNQEKEGKFPPGGESTSVKVLSVFMPFSSRTSVVSSIQFNFFKMRSEVIWVFLRNPHAYWERIQILTCNPGNSSWKYVDPVMSRQQMPRDNVHACKRKWLLLISNMIRWLFQKIPKDIRLIGICTFQFSSILQNQTNTSPPCFCFHYEMNAFY